MILLYTSYTAPSWQYDTDLLWPCPVSPRDEDPWVSLAEAIEHTPSKAPVKMLCILSRSTPNRGVHSLINSEENFLRKYILRLPVSNLPIWIDRQSMKFRHYMAFGQSVGGTARFHSIGELGSELPVRQLYTNLSCPVHLACPESSTTLYSPHPWSHKVGICSSWAIHIRFSTSCTAKLLCAFLVCYTVTRLDPDPFSWVRKFISTDDLLLRGNRTPKV